MHACSLAKPPHHCRDHLLQLPHNSAAFAAIDDRGLHAAFSDTERLAALAQRPREAKRLQRTLSRLAHWCPLFGARGLHWRRVCWWGCRLLASAHQLQRGQEAAVRLPPVKVAKCQQCRAHCITPDHRKHMQCAGELDALPAIAAPFVRLWGADGHGCFEQLASLLINWAAGWWVNYPNPPVALLRKALVRPPPLWWGGRCELHSMQ